jgi:hypothetical protein
MQGYTMLICVFIDRLKFGLINFTETATTKVVNKKFENAAKFKYLKAIVT